VPFTRFAIVDLDGGLLRSGDPVAIQAHDGFYLDVQEDGGVSASAGNAGRTGSFRIWKARGSGAIGRDEDIALQAPSGRYLTAEPGSGRITATGWLIGPAETFRLLPLPE
jgi:hypothetical protein